MVFNTLDHYSEYNNRLRYYNLYNKNYILFYSNHLSFGHRIPSSLLKLNIGSIIMKPILSNNNIQFMSYKGYLSCNSLFISHLIKNDIEKTISLLLLIILSDSIYHILYILHLVIIRIISSTNILIKYYK